MLHSERKRNASFLEDLDENRKLISDLQIESKRIADKDFEHRSFVTEIEKEKEYYRKLAEELRMKLEKQAFEYGEALGRKENEVDQTQNDKRVTITSLI